MDTHTHKISDIVGIGKVGEGRWDGILRDWCELTIPLYFLLRVRNILDMRIKRLYKHGSEY